MAIRNILTGDKPALRGKAVPVKDINQAVLKLLDDMIETMYSSEGVGLAAPQIGVSKRVIVLDPGENRLLEMINPCLVKARGETLEVEGCLSLPALAGEVPRAETVLIRYLDRQGREMELETSGLLARIVQHEVDHLNGVLFIDRAVSLLEPSNGDEGRQT